MVIEGIIGILLVSSKGILRWKVSHRILLDRIVIGSVPVCISYRNCSLSLILSIWENCLLLWVL